MLPEPNTLAPSQKAHQALAIFTQNTDASFRDDFQGEWLSCLFNDSHPPDLLVVAKAGGGKSLSYLLPPLINSKERIVIIQPLETQVNRTITEFRNLKTVNFQNFHKGELIDPQAQVIIATTDAAADTHFCNQLRGCLPTRIIIDNAHSFLEDAYRQYMPGVTALTQLSAQLILTTGSLPPSQEDDLLRMTFGIRRLITKRQPTFRPELNIEVLSSPAEIGQLASVVQPLIDAFVVEPQDRAMIFLENKKAVELLGPRINGVIHHSDLPASVAASAVRRWALGDVKSIVSTSGLGTAINYLHVRLVCIYGIPDQATAITAYQHLGLAGRDGQRAFIYFIAKNSDVNAGSDLFKSNLMNPAVCPANTFAKHLDDLNWSCRNFPSFLPCICCSRLSQFSHPHFSKSAWPNKTLKELDPAGSHSTSTSSCSVATSSRPTQQAAPLKRKCIEDVCHAPED
jgi:superfamily II DNA helicase RecQ